MAAAVRSAWRSRQRRRRGRRTRSSRTPFTATGRIAAVGLAATVAGWTASSLPFYPDGAPWVLALAAAALTLLRDRAGLVLTLAVPVLPLGNVSTGLALAYGAAAVAWIVLMWRDARRALLFAAGPLLAPVAAVGLLPLLLLTVGNPLRRLALAAAGALTAVLVASVGGGSLPFTDEPAPTSLPLDQTTSAARAASTVLDVLSRHPGVLLEAGIVAAGALVLPFVARRGYWTISGYGAAVIAASLLSAQDVAAVPVVVSTWITCVVLGTAAYLREQRLPARHLLDVVRGRWSGGGFVPAPSRAPAE
jgi:hypothetical protein